MLIRWRRSHGPSSQLRAAAAVIGLSLAVGCSASEDPASLHPAGDEVAALRKDDTARPDPRLAFHHDLMGIWRTVVFERGAWVDLIWVMGERRAWHVVTAYADEQLTLPLLRWDIVREYELGEASTMFRGAYELTWTDVSSSLYAEVDAPELFASLGIEDCALVPGERRDLAADNCGAPLFPFRECPLFDFVEMLDETMTFGDPREGDRCERRPTRREAWSFERVRFSRELGRRLFVTGR